MKKILFALIFILTFHSCNLKPKEQAEEAPSYDPSLAYENTEEEAAIEQAAVDKSLAFNNILFDMMETHEEKLLNIKKKLILSDLDLKEFDNKKGSQRSSFITYDTLNHKKTNNEFTLHFLNGDSLLFHDIPVQYDDDLTTYTYIGFLDKIKAYIVEVMLWEDYAYLLINQHDGTINIIESVPRINEHNPSIMMTYDDSPFEGKTTYSIYQLEDRKLKPTHRLVTDHHYVESFYWKNKNTLNIMATASVNDSIVYHKLKIDQ